MLSFTLSAAVMALALQLATAVPLAETNIVANNIAARATGKKAFTVTASEYAQGEFITDIQIDGKPFTVLLDTGSTDFWVKGNGSGPGFNESYGSASASGNVTSGTVTIGGVTIPNQSYGLASNAVGIDKWDGVLGLEPSGTQFIPSLGGNAPKTWLANILPQLPERVFSVDFVAPTEPQKSTYTFGAAASTASDPGALTFPLSEYPDPGWFVNFTSFNVGPPSNAASVCVLDTGTTSIDVPQPVAAAHWAQVPDAYTVDDTIWTFPCNATLPDFVLSIGNQNMTISGKYTTLPNNGTGQCNSLILGTSAEGIDCILGQPFFYERLITYDFGNNSTTFSPKP